MKQIRHRIDKDAPRILPAQRIKQMLLYEANSSIPLRLAFTCRVDAYKTFVWLAFSREAICNFLGIAVAAAFAHPAATANRIPGAVSPFDSCFVHLPLLTHSPALLIGKARPATASASLRCASKAADVSVCLPSRLIEPNTLPA